MSFNLLETVNNSFTNDFVSKSASALGESENSVQKAISGIVPSVLTGLLNKTNSGASSANNIFNMAQEASNSGILNNPGKILSGGSLSSLVNMAANLFGDKLGNISHLISNFAGIKSSSASSLLNMAVPVTLGAIGKYASENNLSASGIMATLTSQKDKILAAIPSGLGLANIFNLGSLSSIGSRMTSVASNVAVETKKGMGWVLPLILGIVLIGLLWYFIKGCGSGKATTGTDTDTSTVITPVTTEPPVANANSIRVKLPDGSELDALRGGIEDRLVAFLNDPNSRAGKDVWFDFDNLNFETNSATITAESQKQVNNIAAILKAFSKVKIKIGGYTDKTGNDAANKKLSQERADAVVAALKTAGAGAQQLEGAEGYGSAFATVPATASEEERRKDRRIAVSVREK